MIFAAILPKLNFAIIDEVDSIILDAAQTPFSYFWCTTYNLIYFTSLKRLLKHSEKDKDFIVNFNKRSVAH